jgi:type II secretory ATPase GspE/PulE/Tfp pilus assembly ATPase PilB-like protein
LDRDAAQSDRWRQGRGCARCFNSGFLGREAIIEMLNIDDPIRQIIYEGTMTQLHRYLAEIEFDSFRVGAIAKVTAGITTVQEVLRVLPHSAMRRKFREEPRSTPMQFLKVP